ncbi:MAG TPA: hypothetical protein VKI61_18290 [Chitinophagaceae bacterium]|nr:hypothetical protein [Chitinophagaceae bacterium]
MRKRKKFWVDSWKFHGSYFDPVPFLNKNHVNKSGPNKKIVRFLWVVIGVAFIILLIELISN